MTFVLRWRFSPKPCFILLLFLSIPLVTYQEDEEKLRIRQAPFCIDDTNTEPHEEGLYNFEDILKFHREENKYVPVSDGKTSPSGLITKFEIKGIQVNDLDSGYSSELHNWLHITVKAAINIEGLYVQAIAAPWGTPFGEFVKNFDCGDCGSHPTSELKNHITIIPCIHRPAFEYTHPNVLTIGGHRQYIIRARKKFKEVHFHFRYTQYPGVEYTFAQFLIIAVRDFYFNASRWETFYSPVYKLDIDKNPIGAYHPFYLGWRPQYLKCHQVSVAGKVEHVRDISVKYKIRYNKMFDDCVVKKEGKQWYTCYPGPFKMKLDEIPTDLASWKELRKRYNLEEADHGLDISSPEKPGSIGGAQFCPDAGTWQWNLGKLEWTTPPNLVLDQHGIDIVDKIVNEDDIYREEMENIDCEEYNKNPALFSKDQEIADICKEEGGHTCEDIHTNDCENLIEIPLPTYGKDENGRPYHKEWEKMSFSEQFDDIAWRWGEKYVLVLHGYLLIFSVTAGFNILAFVARYMKEDKLIVSRSSYFGIGNWLWVHMGVTYLVICTASAGFFLVAHQKYKSGQNEDAHVHGPRDLCNVRPTEQRTDYCLKTIGHRYMGGACVLLFILSYSTGWRRPQSKGLRNIKIFYHLACGYLSKGAGIGSIVFSATSVRHSTLLYIAVIEGTSLLLFIIAEIAICRVDKRRPVEIDPPRTKCPVVEGVDVLENIPGPCYRLKKWLLTIFVIVQITLVFMAMGQHYYAPFD